MRQTIFDLRALLDILRRRGVGPIGVAGMSLGGFATSLLATLEPTLSFALPVIPLSDFADWSREQDSLFGTEDDRARQHAVVSEITRVISPLARPLAISRDRVLVMAGEVDRVTPVHHAERLATHFRASMVRFPGGHLLQFGRREAFRDVLDRMMEASRQAPSPHDVPEES